MAVAMVVKSGTATQRQRERMGVSPGPPMSRPPSGESAMAASSARKPIPAQAKSGEKLPRIQSLIAVSAARTAGPCHRLRITAESSTAGGVKKKIGKEHV